MKKRVRHLSSLCIATLLFIQISQACLHVPVNYKDTVTETTKEAFIFHDGELAHLILKTSIKVEGALPNNLGWVIPIPALPTKYEQLETSLFEELFNLTRPVLKGLRGVEKGVPQHADGIKVHDKQVVGDYEITPIEILSETSGDELNQWFRNNGYGEKPVENQKFYLHKGRVFLALRINKLLGDKSEIKPLHVMYKADRVEMPLKFSGHSGVFDLVLYTFTKTSLPTDALSAYRLIKESQMEISNKEVLVKSPQIKKLLDGQKGVITRFKGTGYNAPNQGVKLLPTDPFLPR